MENKESKEQVKEEIREQSPSVEFMEALELGFYK